MFTLDTAIDTRVGFNFARMFFSKKHKGCNCIAAILTSVGPFITGTETIHHVDLCELFYDSSISVIGELLKTGLQTKLFFCWLAILI
jgi:hypothetical protein